MAVLICVSVTEAEAARLQERGPRRDFVELARTTGGELLYQPAGSRRSGLLGRLFGPHICHA